VWRAFRVNTGAQRCDIAFEVHPAMTNKANSDFPQILLGQLRRDGSSLVLLKAKAG
jgi:hypothetical protein